MRNPFEVFWRKEWTTPLEYFSSERERPAKSFIFADAREKKFKKSSSIEFFFFEEIENSEKQCLFSTLMKFPNVHFHWNSFFFWNMQYKKKSLSMSKKRIKTKREKNLGVNKREFKMHSREKSMKNSHSR